MALVFEDHFAPNFARHPIFRQRLYLVRREPLGECRGVVSLEQVARLPLVLPPLPKHRRVVIDRAFAAAGLTPNIIAETDAGLSELSAVRSGVGSSIYHAGTFKNVYPGAFAEPLLIEPPMFLTCSLVSSSDFPLTHAGEAVKKVLIRFVEDQIRAEHTTRRGIDRMMQYRHLHYFVSVVDAGSFSRAASTIHVAQPALSQQIAQLEELLGVSLLLRSARGVRPTAAGEVLYREASSILKRLQQLPGIVRSNTGTAEGVVRLGMSSTVMTTAPVAFVEQCRTSMPNVEFRMAVSDSPTIMRRVTEHELDLGLVLEDELAPTFTRIPLFRQRLFLIRHHAASKGKPVKLAELASLPLILPPSPNMTRTALDRALAKAKLSLNVVMEADIVANIIAAVRAECRRLGAAEG